MYKKTVGFKTSPVVKEAIAQLALYRGEDRGDVLLDIVKEAVQKDDFQQYIQRYVKEKLNKYNYEIQGIIDDISNVVAKEFYQNQTEIISSFTEKMERNDLLSVDEIEESEVSDEWFEYLNNYFYNEIKRGLEGNLKKSLGFSAEENLGFSAEFLLLAMPNLIKHIKAQSKAIIDIMTGSIELSLTYFISAIAHLRGKLEITCYDPVRHFGQLVRLMEKLNGDEKRWLLCLYYHYDEQKDGKILPIPEIAEFINETLKKKEYTIFKNKRLDSNEVMEKILNEFTAQKLNPIWS